MTYECANKGHASAYSTYAAYSLQAALSACVQSKLSCKILNICDSCLLASASNLDLRSPVIISASNADTGILRSKFEIRKHSEEYKSKRRTLLTGAGGCPPPLRTKQIYCCALLLLYSKSARILLGTRQKECHMLAYLALRTA